MTALSGKQMKYLFGTGTVLFDKTRKSNRKSAGESLQRVEIKTDKRMYEIILTESCYSSCCCHDPCVYSDRSMNAPESRASE